LGTIGTHYVYDGKKMETKIPKGFSANAVRSRIRGRDRLDLGLIVSDIPAAAAGVFTRSLVKAAPVLYDREIVANGRARAILVNSGIANACTGEEGMRKAKATAGMAADALGIAREEVLVASTGVIGMELDLSCFANHMAELATGLSPEGFEPVSRAMMTTDTVPKVSYRSLEIGGEKIRIFGLAKGAGMIHPDMATMLAFIVTDAHIDAAILQKILRRRVDTSFNRITIDGDTSTNDSVLVLANGRAGNPLLADEEAAAAFSNSMGEVMEDLALKIVADGEGASKLIHVRVKGAPDDHAAAQAAMTVATSSLVKTAFFGCDANWGRILAALGRSGVAFDPGAVAISFGGVILVKEGMALGGDSEARATEVLKGREIDLDIDLGAGGGAAVYHTSDLSIDYVKINADYRT